MTFETRLLDELQQIVAAQPAPAPRRRLVPVAVAAAVAAVIAVVLLASGGGPAPAYAIDKAANGTVTVQIKSLRDSAGLEQKLADLGVKAKVDYLEPGMTCQAGRFKPARGVRNFRVGRSTTDTGSGTFTIDPPKLGRDQTLVVIASEGTLDVAFADGPVGPCLPVKDTRAPLPQPPTEVRPPAGPGLQQGTGPDKGLQQHGG